MQKWKAEDKIRSDINGVRKEKSDDKDVYRAVKAVLIAFAPIRHIQTEFEFSSRPTMMKVVPLLQELKSKLSCLASGMVDPTKLNAPQEHTQSLAKRTIEVRNHLHYHDL